MHIDLIPVSTSYKTFLQTWKIFPEISETCSKLSTFPVHLNHKDIKELEKSVELLTPYQPERTLRSCSYNNLQIPKTRLVTYGDRAFTSTGPSVWNALPLYVKQITDFD